MSAALIAGGAALAVALLGIAGTIAAQLIATRRAYANSLALFERQHAQEQAASKQQRDEDARREDAHRFADQRRATYARFLQLADEAHRAHGNAGVLLDVVERHEARQDDAGELQQSLARRADADFHANFQRAEHATDQLRGLLAEVDLLGSADVRDAARQLYRAAAEFAGYEFAPARDAFADESRGELGIDPQS